MHWSQLKFQTFRTLTGNINRNNNLKKLPDTQFYLFSVVELHRGSFLDIIFIHEKGIDAGGLIKEYFIIVSKGLKYVKHNLFVKIETDDEENRCQIRINFCLNTI
jgi:hypothetical protein